MRRTLGLSAFGFCLGLVVIAAGNRLSAGPVKSFENPAAKNEDVEKAGASLQKGQFDEALKHLQDAVKRDPTLPPPRLMLANMLLNTKDGVAQGRSMLEQAAKETPDDPRVYETNAFVAMGDGRIIDAILNAETALQLANATRWTADIKKKIQIQCRQVLAAAFERRNDWASARTQIAAWLEVENSAPVRQRLAQALFFLDKPDEAYSELQRAVKDDAMLDPPAVRMAQLWALKGDATMAREWFEKSVKAEANSIKVHIAYANWLLTQNEIEQANIHAAAAAKIDSKSLDVLKLQGLIARITKDLGRAESLFRQIMVDAPGDFFAANQLALVLADQSDSAQRSRGLQLASVNYNANQRSAEAAATLGYCQFRTGDTESAFRSLSAAIAPGQLSADTGYYLALVLIEKDKADDAVKLLDGALRTKGLFIYRKEAQSLHDKHVKKEPAKDGKDKAKTAPK